MKTLILNEATWRCGSNSEENSPSTARGKGVTLLLNKLGESCCLGQFAPQLNKKVSSNHLHCGHSPSSIGLSVPLLNKATGGRMNTVLTSKAIFINDDKDTTIEMKVFLLRDLFKPKGYKIVFRRRKKSKLKK